MRYLRSVILPLSGMIVLLTVNSFIAPKKALNEVRNEVFVGTSPCAQSARAFLKITDSEKCDEVKWKLTLMHNQETKQSTGFILEREYKIYIDNRTDKSQGTISIKGDWKLEKGTKEDANAMIYKLHSGEKTISFLKVDDNLLHLLEPDKSLSIGNGGQSFTLSKTGSNISASSRPFVKGIGLSSSGIKDTMIRFVGRTPCQEIAKELKIKTDPDCFKLKWDLRLFQDPISFAPTKYELRRTGHRESVIVGKWKIIKAEASDPKTIIFQLDPDKPQSQYFLKGDDNILFFVDKQTNFFVGNDLFSYTLNRSSNK